MFHNTKDPKGDPRVIPVVWSHVIHCDSKLYKFSTPATRKEYRVQQARVGARHFRDLRIRVRTMPFTATPNYTSSQRQLLERNIAYNKHVLEPDTFVIYAYEYERWSNQNQTNLSGLIDTFPDPLQNVVLQSKA